MKTAKLLLLALTLVACREQGGPTTTQLSAPITTSASTPATIAGTVPATTLVPATSIDPHICGEDEAALICEVHRLVAERYVDPVPDSELAAAAGASVDALDQSIGASPECLIPNEIFEVVCEAMTDEGVTTSVAEIAAIEGMIGVLDPNSLYLSAEALRLLEEDQSGSVEGIGALVSAEDSTAADPEASSCPEVTETCRLVVVSTFADGPARRAGLDVGDVLVAVDGQSILGWTIDEVTAAVRGPAGTQVELRVDRGGALVDLSIVRAAITIPVVETDQVGEVGYLRLNLFTDTSDSQVHDAIAGLLDDGSRRLVLDLRDNPGGALHATVEIASEFLPGGVVVRTEGPDENLSYEADVDGLLADSTPMVILVNGGSASASEVLAAALQERHRALVIGTATFGKNTVQQRYGLSDGGALKLTVARWVTEAGADFGETGVQPDIEAELDPELTIDELVAEVSRLSGW